MGNQPSFQQHNDFKDLQTNYTYEKKYTDTRFGEVKLLRENTTGTTLFQKDFSSNTPKEFEDYVREIQDASVLAHPGVIRVFGYNSKKEDLFCADFYKLQLFFESFDSDLEKEISKRQHTKEYFSEHELWYILDCVASACAYLQHNKIAHTDIRPFNILITSKKDYKVTATPLFRLSYNPGYFGHFEGLDARSRYYSPELLAHFSKPEKERKPFDPYKNDMFALGMTLLEVGLLDKTPSVYNFDKLEVKREPINEALNKLRTRYSENLVLTIEKALDFNPDSRLDFVRLDSELGPYRNDILEKARGNTSLGSPYVSPPETKIVNFKPDSPIKAVHAQNQPTYLSDELDHRVREAVRKSEEVIKKSSPTKYSNKHLDPYIQSYLRNDLKHTEQTVLAQISPYLTSESKYTTTLTIEQPNYGRESQPINFNQPVPRDDLNENVKRSGYVDLGSSVQNQPTYNPQPVVVSSNTGGIYDQSPGLYQGNSFGQPVGTSGGRYGQVEYSAGMPSNYGQSAGYGGTTTVVETNYYGDASQKNYASEADDLSKKIAERLAQSKQLYS